MVLRQMVLNFFEKSFKKFKKSAKKYQLNLDHFQSQQQINQILQLQYQMHRFAVQLVF